MLVFQIKIHQFNCNLELTNKYNSTGTEWLCNSPEKVLRKYNQCKFQILDDA